MKPEIVEAWFLGLLIGWLLVAPLMRVVGRSILRSLES